MLKFRDMKLDITGELTKRLYALAKNLGVQNVPDAEQIKAIMSQILNHYRDFNLEEIANAFSEALANRFEVDVNHYGSFDVVYVSRILNAYRPYREKIRAKEMARKKDEERTAMLQQSNNLSEEDRQELATNAILEHIEAHGKLPYTGDWDRCFKRLEMLREISDTNEEKQKFKDRVLVELAETVKYAKREGRTIEYELAKKILDNPALLKSECRKRRVIEYLTDKYELP